jgi:hypothetical protein
MWENLRTGTGMHGVELPAACGPFPAGSRGTLLPSFCPHPSRHSVLIPFTWWHVCQGGSCCGWRGIQQPYLPVAQVHGLVMPRVPRHKAGWPLYLDSPLCQGGLMACSMLGQLAWLAAILVKEMPAVGCTSNMPAATLGSEGGDEFC